MSPFPDSINPKQHVWLQNTNLTRIFNVVANAGGEVRVVGGAVRDALLGRPVHEIDLAVNKPPDQLISLFNNAGIKTIPTGLEHGTLTLVLDHKSYEITSLRRDIKTDGRHAEVIFTDHWSDDAARRDFTFNALYVDARGEIYDYFGGRQDLAAGTVRFIGDARQRIKEDVLRILRFFRFYAWFGKGPINPEGLKACQELAKLLPQISAERIWRETTKLLAATNPIASLEAMQQSTVLDIVMPELNSINSLDKLIFLEKSTQIQPQALVRLMAIINQSPSSIKKLVLRLKLSNKEADILEKLSYGLPLFKNQLESQEISSLLYEYGAELVQNMLLLLISCLSIGESSLGKVLTACSTWQKPVFPLRGDDLLKSGLKSGPAMGQLLRQTEVWWIEHHFKPDQASCLTEALRLAKLSDT